MHIQSNVSGVNCSTSVGSKIIHYNTTLIDNVRQLSDLARWVCKARGYSDHRSVQALDGTQHYNAQISLSLRAWCCQCCLPPARTYRKLAPNSSVADVLSDPYFKNR